MQRSRRGLTLIEVLIIIVMIGILLTIAIQKIGSRRAKSSIESLKADIGQVRDAESKYFGVHNAYGSRAQLDSAGAIVPATGNVLSITATQTGYTVSASNSTDAANPRTCTLDARGGENAALQNSPDCK